MARARRGLGPGNHHARPNLAAPWPQIPLPYPTNGVNLQFIEPSPTGNTFYRLHKP